MKISIQALMESLPKPIVAHIQHLERIRQDFVANVSHELRTPLTVMHGYLEILLDQDLDETKPWRKMFLQMQQQTARMENLVENLLLLSRLENNEQEKALKSVISVTELLSCIQEEAQQLSSEAQHQIELQAEGDLMLRGSAAELRSLFSNIIFNAVKYTPEQGQIKINWYSQNNKAYFSVQDSGIGIAAKHIPRLTERFYRVDKARSRDNGGTGLGLAIVKHVLIRHGGKLMIESEPDKGSIFTCIFPKQRLVKKVLSPIC